MVLGVCPESFFSTIERPPRSGTGFLRTVRVSSLLEKHNICSAGRKDKTDLQVRTMWWQGMEGREELPGCRGRTLNEQQGSFSQLSAGTKNTVKMVFPLPKQKHLAKNGRSAKKTGQRDFLQKVLLWYTHQKKKLVYIIGY